MKRTLYTFCVLVTAVVQCLGDPCDPSEYVEINDVHRSAGFRTTLMAEPFCDDILEVGWYRFTSEAGGTMPEHCVNTQHCGTEMPVWMNGTHPSVADGIVKRLVCANVNNGESSSPLCCERSRLIGVKNCGTFYVYLLSPTPACPMSYCAGDREVCPAGFSGFPPNCTEQFPLLTDPPVLEGPEIEDGRFYFYCKIRTPHLRQNESFQVSWAVDDQILPSAPSVSTKDTAIKLDGFLLQGHLNKYVSCKVKTFYDSTSHITSPWLKSNTYWAGIKIEPDRLEISEAEETKNISVVATLPKVCDASVRRSDCLIMMDVKVQGSVGDTATAHSCTYMIARDDWDDVKKEARVNIQVTARRDHIRNYAGRVVVFGFEPVQDFLGVFNNAVIQPIHIDVHDADERRCSIIGDPHIRGMEYTNSEYYNLYKIGDYTLYENKNRYFEAQIRTYMCRPDVRVSCTCGVAIREYDDLIRVQNCNDFVLGRRTASPTIDIPRGGISDGTSIERTRDGMQIVVYLPSSTEVRITQTYWGLDVELIIPGTDKGHGQGLCGTFDGISSNEFTHRGGARVDTNCERQDLINNLGCVPESFSESWRNNDATSLFKTTPPPLYIKETRVFCTCVNELPGSNITCSARGDVSKKILQCGGANTCEKVSSTRGFRQTRAVEEQVYTDADDNISVYDPEDFKDFQPATPTWPTPSGITEAEAERMCRSAVQSSQVWTLCNAMNATKPIDLESCKIDILFTDSNESVVSYVNSFTADCQVEIATDPKNYVNDSSGESTLKPEVAAVQEVCSADCLKNGRCQQGHCVCNSGFTGESCQLLVGVGPRLIEIDGSSACDVNIKPCRKVYIIASNFEATDLLACKVQEILANGSISSLVSNETAEFINNGKLACTLPDAQVKTDRSVKTFVIKATMDGTLYGTEVRLTIFDSTCWNCTNSGCERMLDACLIDNLCYSDGDLNPLAEDQICNAQSNFSQWSDIPSDYPKIVSVTLSGPTSDNVMICALNTTDDKVTARFKVSWYVNGQAFPFPRELSMPASSREVIFNMQDMPSTGILACKMRSYYTDRNIYSPYVMSNTIDLAVLAANG